MFGFHWPELLVILLAAVAIFGPKRLPEVGGALGRGLRDLRHGLHDVQEETGIAEIKEHVRDVRDTVLTVPREVEASTRPSGPGANPETAMTASGRTESGSTSIPEKGGAEAWKNSDSTS